MKRHVSILTFVYNSYRDPLFQNIILTYIKTLSTSGNFRFDLITFEQSGYQLSTEDEKREKELLKQWNIHWHPRKFQTGSFLLVKKAVNVIDTLFIVSKLKWKYSCDYTFAFANVSAAISVLFTQLLGMKLVIYSYEPHSDFMVELGHWKKAGLKYQILNRLEKMAGRHASHIMTGTKHMKQKLEDEGSKAIIYRAPTAVDPKNFQFSSFDREKIRKSLNLSEEYLYIYPGKLGGLYYAKELIELFETIYVSNPKSFFLIASDYDQGVIGSWFEESKIPSSSYHIRAFIDSREIPAYLSAADMGIVAIPPTPSQRYRSPTKVAEYLLCGLPYITCVGVSEDDEIAETNKVGIALKEFSSNDVRSNMNRIMALLIGDKHHMRSRCRQVGLNYRSKEQIDNFMHEIFSS